MPTTPGSQHRLHKNLYIVAFSLLHPMFSHEQKGTEKTNCLKALDIHMPCFLIKTPSLKKHTDFHKKEKKRTRKSNCRTTWYILKHLEIQQPKEFSSHFMRTQYITGLTKPIPQEC